MADTRLDALRGSVDRLRTIVDGIADGDLTARAYPSEWTIADVMSHLGSGAVISQRRLIDIVAGTDTPDDFAEGVWAEWNAKTPAAQRSDCLAADADFMQSLEEVSAGQREAFGFSMGPIDVDFDGFVAMRLNEHALHTWDIEVAGDSAATLPAGVTSEVIDNLDLIARFTAKPTGDPTTITVATADPERGFAINISHDAVTLTSSAPDVHPDLALPAEAFIRLVYGRLDPEHTPPGAETLHLEQLRRVYPGP